MLCYLIIINKALLLHYLLQSVFYCFLLLGFIGEILMFQICIALLRYLQNSPIFALSIRSYYIYDEG